MRNFCNNLVDSLLVPSVLDVLLARLLEMEMIYIGQGCWRLMMVVSLKFPARTLTYDTVMSDDGDEVDDLTKENIDF